MAFDKTQDFSTSTTPVDAYGWFDDRDQIFGGSAGDKLAGSRGDDEIHGGDGNDTIIDLTEQWAAWVGPSLFLGPRGPLGSQPTRLDLAHAFEDMHADDLDGVTEWQGWRVITYQEGGDDRFFGDGGDDTLAGRSGDDFLDGGADNDEVWGGTGDDTLLGGSGDDNLYGNTGNDILLGGLGEDILLGGTGADVLQGGSGADIIEGGDVPANAFAALVTQGVMTQAQANAALAALNAGDKASYALSLSGVNVDFERATQLGGDAQGDTITGVENLDGSRNSDNLRGDDKINVIFGDRGNDILEGRGGADTLNGGDNVDTASYESSSGGVVVDLLAATQRNGDAQGDTLISIENLRGSQFGDTLRGDDTLAGNLLVGDGGNDTLEGRGGNDRLFGGDGIDTLDGGNDNDVLNGGLGNDTLRGGNGFDTVELNTWDTPAPAGGVLFIPSQVTVRLGLNGGDGSAVRSDFSSSTFSFVETERDVLRSIEKVVGSNNVDTFFGNELDNEFDGYLGNDVFKTDLGRDTYDGGDGVDTVDYSASPAATGVNATIGGNVRGIGGFAEGDLLFNIEDVTGTAGRDTIHGNGSNNRLTGGGGDDTLNGGGGEDTIVGGTETDVESLTGGAGRDTFLYLSRADSFTRADHTGDIITDFNTDQDTIDLRALGVNVANLKLDDTGTGALREGHLFEDLNGNGFADGNEFNINLQLTGSATFSLQDVLV